MKVERAIADRNVGDTAGRNACATWTPRLRCVHPWFNYFMRKIPRKLSIARGEQPAELLFKNARLVNVLSGEIHRANIAVDDGRVVGLGDYRAKKVIDLR